MTHAGPGEPGSSVGGDGVEGLDEEGWTGATVRDRDGANLGTLVEVLPPGKGGSRGRWGIVRSVLGRRRVVPLDGAADDGTGDVAVPVDRDTVLSAPALDGDATDPGMTTELATGRLHRHYTGRGVLADAREVQHERFGGAKLGSAFFGWLVSVGLTVLLGVLAGVVTAAAVRTPPGPPPP